jgi:hypothetical protein
MNSICGGIKSWVGLIDEILGAEAYDAGEAL